MINDRHDGTGDGEERLILLRAFVSSWLTLLLSLAERVAALAVERVQPLGLDDVEAGAGDALLQRHRLRVRDRRAGLAWPGSGSSRDPNRRNRAARPG